MSEAAFRFWSLVLEVVAVSGCFGAWLWFALRIRRDADSFDRFMKEAFERMPRGEREPWQED